MPGQILAGGGLFSGSRLDDYVLELGGPRICAVPTATAYPETALVSFYEQHGFSVVGEGDDYSVSMRRQLETPR